MKWSLALSLACLLTAGVAWCHPALDLQLEELSRQIAEAPQQADLYLKRGDLRRRHGDWTLAAQDFETARTLEPRNPEIDWYEGRLYIESGEWAEAEALLTRFLETHPEHVGAYQARAEAGWGMGNPHAAAHDYAQAVAVSRKPTPTLYRSLIISQIRRGEAHHSEAAASVDAGLERFPNEVSLLGLGVDLALADPRPDRAEAYMTRLPPGTDGLPQWIFRQALLACLEGRTDSAASQFSTLTPSGGASAIRRTGTWSMPLESVEELAQNPTAKTCRSAAADSLDTLQP